MLAIANIVVATEFKISDFGSFAEMQQAITDFVKLADEGITIDWSRSYIMHNDDGVEIRLIAL